MKFNFYQEPFEYLTDEEIITFIHDTRGRSIRQDYYLHRWQLFWSFTWSNQRKEIELPAIRGWIARLKPLLKHDKKTDKLANP